MGEWLEGSWGCWWWGGVGGIGLVGWGGDSDGVGLVGWVVVGWLDDGLGWEWLGGWWWCWVVECEWWWDGWWWCGEWVIGGGGWKSWLWF